MSNVYYEDVEVGHELPPLTKNCSTRQLVIWAGGSGDYYEIHYDPPFATGVAHLPGIIVHGALKHGFLGQLISDWTGDPRTIKRVGCAYRGMDFPNEDIVCKGVVTAKRQENGENLVEVEIWTENPEGKKTTPGTALVNLPSRNS